jgi:oligosaccharyltransferase complex subunit gamma
MRFLRSLLTASLLIAGSLAAKKPSADRFHDFQTKALKASPIKLGESSYKSITKAPRDYSVAILLTALDARFGCQLCRDFQPEWDLLGRSWTQGDKKGESRMLFGTLDFADGREVFMSVCGRGNMWQLVCLS